MFILHVTRGKPSAYLINSRKSIQKEWAHRLDAVFSAFDMSLLMEQQLLVCREVDEAGQIGRNRTGRQFEIHVGHCCKRDHFGRAGSMTVREVELQ